MIGYYVHHHGSGHLARAHEVIAHLKSPVTVLSSLPQPKDWAGEWLQLASDDTHTHPVDPTANGTLHWVPRHDPGIRKRSRQLAEWFDARQPHLLVVDVSVEVTALARLCGVPVAIMAMPGDRADRAHRFAYTMADLLIAPWPRGHDLGRFETEWAAKIQHVGAFSKFDSRPSPERSPKRAARPHAVLLWGSGGIEETDKLLEEVRAATPQWSWTLAGPGNFLNDDELWNELCSADAVVTHAGQNAIADVAAARKPAIVISSPRPFGEQERSVRALNAARIAIGLEVWPAAASWSDLLERACAVGGRGWQNWSTGHGAADCAVRLEELAARRVDTAHAVG